MQLWHLDDCDEFAGGDKSRLRELFHPEKTPLELNYSLAHATVDPGKTTKPHRLEGHSEVYYIMEGEGVMHIEDETSTVSAGHAVYIPPGALQYIENNTESPLVFICIVEPAWRAENETVFD
ncbi:MAG: cupin domain-containing protein [Actinobacteria bacterium]|nr:cupin domain-containing protein [Actinomycetota bacterium]